MSTPIIRMHTQSASPEGNLSPGCEYVVGPDGEVSLERARDLLDGGFAELVRGENLETARQAPPAESAVHYRVEQSGSWYTIYDGDEEVDKVRGQDALDERLTELEG